jgi:hypothetical protein
MHSPVDNEYYKNKIAGDEANRLIREYFDKLKLETQTVGKDPDSLSRIRNKLKNIEPNIKNADAYFNQRFSQEHPYHLGDISLDIFGFFCGSSIDVRRKKMLEKITSDGRRENIEFSVLQVARKSLNPMLFKDTENQCFHLIKYIEQIIVNLK